MAIVRVIVKNNRIVSIDFIIYGLTNNSSYIILLDSLGAGSLNISYNI